MSTIRTYKLQHFANKSKQEKVFAVLKEYRVSCHQIAQNQWRKFFDGGQFNKMDKLGYVTTKLSERYKQNCAYQVDSCLQSFLSNLQLRFKELVYHSSIKEEKRAILFRINARKCWYAKEHELFSKEDLWLARKIFKRLLDTHQKPRMYRCNMLLNQNVSVLSKADKAKTKLFDYWIRFSTLEKGKPILIPVKSNDYFDSKEGILKAATQFNFGGDKFTVSLMKDIPASKIEFKTEKVTLDFGLKSLFTTSDGCMFGKDFYNVVQKYDAIISGIAANRQRQGFKLNTSSRYNNLVFNLQNYIKNEINRVLNKIVEQYGPKKIVVERLNFQGAHLSKKLNRILQNCGRKVIQRKLADFECLCGIEIVEVNPAYTSQECSHCHYVDKKNRIKQDTFSCKNCGKVLHADVNAARVQDYRSSISRLANIYTGKSEILRLVVMGFLEQNYSRLNSKAKGLLANNPYFKERMAQPKLLT